MYMTAAIESQNGILPNQAIAWFALVEDTAGRLRDLAAACIDGAPARAATAEEIAERLTTSDLRLGHASLQDASAFMDSDPGVSWSPAKPPVLDSERHPSWWDSTSPASFMLAEMQLTVTLRACERHRDREGLRLVMDALYSLRSRRAEMLQ
jgi:hypothetical protein